MVLVLLLLPLKAEGIVGLSKEGRRGGGEGEERDRYDGWVKEDEGCGGGRAW